MQSAGAHQTFGLGSLIGPHGSSAPIKTVVETEGRGVFAKVHLAFEFDDGDSSVDRLFLLEKPSDAVASRILVNGSALDSSADRESAARILPNAQMQALEDALSVPSSHLLVVEIGQGTVLSTVSIQFILAVDLQWHKGAFHFRSPHGLRKVAFEGRWELSGLPGAGIAFSGAARPCRLETLENARHRWSEPLEVTPENAAVVEFSLDEKKAASIAVFCPPPAEDTGPGCAAVAVVAPVRPQLAREPIRLAIMVEIRNPQEGLLMRSLVEKVTTLLKPQDEFSLLLLGTETPSSLVSWSASDAISDDLLAKLLEPSGIGRAPDLWANLQTLTPHLRTATHLLIATSGAPTFPGKGLVTNTPVFVFATGRRPFKSQLESLSQRSGGFLMEGTNESLEILLERMRIRLSPPLLSDFKLEGWNLNQIRPASATQVYTDQPTLVFGLYDGLLPKTVTLSGQSPARQKLAQRVKVETLEEINLMPLYQDRLARWDGEEEPVDRWEGGGVTARSVSHAETLHHFYVAEPVVEETMSSVVTLDFGAAPPPPPTIGMASGAVEIDSSLLGAPGDSLGDFFDEPSTMPLDGPVEAFEGIAEPSFGEADLFYSDSQSGGSSEMGSPVQIRKAEPAEEESELFEDPSELNRSMLKPPEDDDNFQLPSGPPMIFKTNESGESPAEAAPPRRSEASQEDSGQKRRLVSLRPKQDEPTSVPAAVPIDRVRTQEGWSSEWLERFEQLEAEQAREWLESCSIDYLGLSVSLLEPSQAEELLARLPAQRQRAVRTQMEWGKLLEGYECEEADRQLALALTRAY